MASEPDYEYLGCGDGNCEIERPKGVHTNGGCMCLRGMDHEKRIRLRKAMRRGVRLRELLRQALEGDAVTENGDWIAEVVDVLLYAPPPVPEAPSEQVTTPEATGLSKLPPGLLRHTLLRAAGCLAAAKAGRVAGDIVPVENEIVSILKALDGTDHDHT